MLLGRVEVGVFWWMKWSRLRRHWGGKFGNYVGW